MEQQCSRTVTAGWEGEDFFNAQWCPVWRLLHYINFLLMVPQKQKLFTWEETPIKMAEPVQKSCFEVIIFSAGMGKK